MGACTFVELLNQLLEMFLLHINIPLSITNIYAIVFTLLRVSHTLLSLPSGLCTFVALY